MLIVRAVPELGCTATPPVLRSTLPPLATEQDS
jgi:hypothetical protein